MAMKLQHEELLTTRLRLRPFHDADATTSSRCTSARTRSSPARLTRPF
ncbi:MAG: hypothetical protein AVDCRST_MAG72-2050 [uncultured Nocardioidaceae bacterium]|uniref:Uncharacterized protein n=1 Tax=uncultured Nocardioidaceae bacterium TaxID=253824 RepID=A0A6J4MKM1_9ACTN|nr:MAG: hypothetical protein AVDCRST_MAG72-2050 [uncultured Nocardioidaceae bacterium]